MIFCDGFFDLGHESLLYHVYTHFQILNQMMDVLSFVLDIVEEWCRYSVNNGKSIPDQWALY